MNFVEDNAGNLQFYWQLASAKDSQVFQDRIREITEKIGFSDFIFFNIDALCGNNINVASSLENELVNQYLSQYAAIDMIIDHFRSENKPKPILFSILKEYIGRSPITMTQIKSMMSWSGVLEAHNYFDSYSICSILEKDNSKMYFSLFSKDVKQDEFTERVNQYKTIINLLTEAISFIALEKFSDIFSYSPPKSLPITPKPLRLLTTIAKEGLTLKQAADKLCISLDTANKHIAAAKRALDTNTIGGAVYRAVQKGLITLDLEQSVTNG